MKTSGIKFFLVLFAEMFLSFCPMMAMTKYDELKVIKPGDEEDESKQEENKGKEKEPKELTKVPEVFFPENPASQQHDLINSLQKNSENKPSTTFEDLPDLLQTRILLEAKPKLVRWLLNAKDTVLEHAGDISDFAITPDSKKVITGTCFGTLVIWDVDTGKKIRILKGHFEGISKVLITPDGKKVITKPSSDYNPTVKIYDIETGNLLATLRHDFLINCIEITPDSKKVITLVCGRKSAIIWNIETGQQLHILQDHGKSINCLAITPDGKKVITGSEDHTAIIWNIENGKKIKTLNHEDKIDKISISPDSKKVITITVWGRYSAIVWDIETGQKLNILETSNPFHIKMSPNGKRVISSLDKNAIIHSTTTGKQLANLQGHKGYIRRLAITPDGKKVITGSEDHIAIIWDTKTGKPLKTLQFYQSDNSSIPNRSIHNDIEVESIEITPDSKKVIISTSYSTYLVLNNSVTLWDIETGNLLATFPVLESRINCLKITPDGKKIIFSSGYHTSNNQAIIWKIKDDESLEELAIMSKRQLRIIKLAYEAAQKGKKVNLPTTLKNDVESLPPLIKTLVQKYLAAELEIDHFEDPDVQELEQLRQRLVALEMKMKLQSKK